jgi:hypothetical protein
MTTNNNNRLDEAYQILISLGLPRGQHNERSALCLLALLNLTPKKTWAQAENPLVGITPIMDWRGITTTRNTRQTHERHSDARQYTSLLMPGLPSITRTNQIVR